MRSATPEIGAKPARRPLRFGSLADAVADAEALLASGYDKVGNWTLGQCTGHLANWLGYPIDGFPRAPLPVRLVMAVLRATSGKRKLKEYIETQSFPAGAPTAPQSVPTPDTADRDGVEKLKAAANRLMAYDGPIVPSPFFGPMDKATLLRLQCVHAAHHLSFLLPRT